MSGYNTIMRIRQLEKDVSELGLKIDKSTIYGYDRDYADMIALYPKDNDSLPIYNRQAELFTGTLEQLEVWLRGVEWARSYDQMLKVSDSKKRERKEQDYRNSNLIRILKGEEKVDLKK